MPARVVLVLDEPGFAEKAAKLLNEAGYDTAPLSDPYAALDALEGARKIEVLVTCEEYGPGKPNGISLALMARHKRPGIKVIFVGTAGTADFAEGVAVFLQLPVTVDGVARAVTEMLCADELSEADLIE